MTYLLYLPSLRPPLLSVLRTIRKKWRLALMMGGHDSLGSRPCLLSIEGAIGEES